MQRTLHRVFATAGMLAVLLTLSAQYVFAQSSKQGKWADENDPVAKQLIEEERKWAIDYCVPTDVVDRIMADDFVGTSPAGPIYTKAEMLKKHSVPLAARDCKLLSAKVRFYGSDVAIVYGSETAIRKGDDGKDFNRTLIWTDTWMKRDNKWQLIAVQDMIDPAKK